MNREVHVRFWESAGVRFLCATHLSARLRIRGPRQSGNRAVHPLLQHRAAAFIAGQTNPGRVLLRDAAGDSTGSLSGEHELTTASVSRYVASADQPPPWTTLHRCQTRRAPLRKSIPLFGQPVPPQATPSQIDLRWRKHRPPERFHRESGRPTTARQCVPAIGGDSSPPRSAAATPALGLRACHRQRRTGCPRPTPWPRPVEPSLSRSKSALRISATRAPWRAARRRASSASTIDLLDSRVSSATPPASSQPSGLLIALPSSQVNHSTE